MLWTHEINVVGASISIAVLPSSINIFRNIQKFACATSPNPLTPYEYNRLKIGNPIVCISLPCKCPAYSMLWLHACYIKLFELFLPYFQRKLWWMQKRDKIICCSTSFVFGFTWNNTIRYHRCRKASILCLEWHVMQFAYDAKRLCWFYPFAWARFYVSGKMSIFKRISCICAIWPHWWSFCAWFSLELFIVGAILCVCVYDVPE